MTIAALEKYALASDALIQFKDAAGALIFAQKPDLGDDGKQKADEDGQPLTVNDLEQPIGVRMVAPGSKAARAADDDVTKLVRQRNKDLTRKQIEAQSSSPSFFLWLGNQRAARMVTEFVGFDFNGKGASIENTIAFLEEPKWKTFADQIRSATGADELFLQKDSAS